MTNRSVVFLHGFASSAAGRKATYLAERFKHLPEFSFWAIDFNPTPRDFRYMTVTGQIGRLRQFLLDREVQQPTLIGSSMGALIALQYAHRYRDVERLILLAPSLTYFAGKELANLGNWCKVGHTEVFSFGFQRPLLLDYGIEEDGQRYQDAVPPACPATIVHGKSDEVIPISHSRDYAARFPDSVSLVEVDSDHRLSGHLDLIWRLASNA